MYAEPLPAQEIKVFVEREGKQILVANFFTTSFRSMVGDTLDIELFKEEPVHPNTVRILRIREHFDAKDSQAQPFVVLSITGEPV
jgi:hypothetical protein